MQIVTECQSIFNFRLEKGHNTKSKNIKVETIQTHIQTNIQTNKQTTVGRILRLNEEESEMYRGGRTDGRRNAPEE